VTEVSRPAVVRLQRFLDPRTIAIIGASERNRTAASVVRNLRDFGFSGQVFPVNPNYTELLGFPCYPSVEAIGTPVDLAVLLVPADAVPASIRSCIAADIGAAIIMSAGFAEAERGRGREREAELQDAVSGSDILICGPNSEGYFNICRGISLSFSGSVSYEFLRNATKWAGPEADLTESLRGGVAVVAQSGGLGFSIFGQGVEIGIGFSHVISVGNEFDLDVLDCAEYLIAQPEVRVVAMYVEGLCRPERLREVAAMARSAGKALVIGKAGRTESGQKAALSHTGHIAGDTAMNDAAFEAFGIVSVADQSEMLDVCAALALSPPTIGGRVGVVTWSGGSAVWAADACEKHGLEVPELDDALKADLGKSLPEFASIRNPIDLTASAKATPGDILKTIGDAPYLDAFVLIAPLNSTQLLGDDLPEISRLVHQLEKPVVIYSYTTPHQAQRAVFREVGVPIYESSTRAARAIAALRRVGTRPDVPRFENVAPLPSGPSRVVSEHATTDALRAAGFPVTRQMLVTSPDQAVRAATDIGGQVAMKLQAPSIPHKQKAGGVMLGVIGDRAVEESFRTLMARAADVPDVEGVLVQELVEPGLEMLVGIDNTSGFGPVLVLGFGGSNVETMNDATLRCAPVDADQARQMITQLRHGALLTEPLAGLPSYALGPLIDFVVKLSHFAWENATYIRELDINPLIVTADGVTIVDAMMVSSGPG
jgi:acyl-CoA synthetase (NDP forming)